MKRIALFVWFFALLIFTNTAAFAVETDVDRLLDLLVDKNVITADDAAGFRADLAIKKVDDLAAQKEFGAVTGRTIKVSGLAQFRYQSTPEAGKLDGADVRRARLDIKSDITSNYDIDTQFEFGGNKGPFLLDATLGYKRGPDWKFTAGQFKVPFSQENLASDTRPDTINRSQVVEALVARGSDVIGNSNGRDVGVQISGGLFPREQGFAVDYAAGLFNGSGINVSDKNDQKDLAGRLVYHNGKGLDVGASHYDGVGNWGTPAKNFKRDRDGVEFTWVRSVWTLKGEYIAGKDNVIRRKGGYFQTAYQFTPGKLAGVLKYDTYDPDASKAKDRKNVLTFGVSRYFNKWTTFLVNYERKREPGAEIDNDLASAQLILSF